MWAVANLLSTLHLLLPAYCFVCLCFQGRGILWRPLIQGVSCPGLMSTSVYQGLLEPLVRVCVCVCARFPAWDWGMGKQQRLKVALVFLFCRSFLNTKLLWLRCMCREGTKQNSYYCSLLQVTFATLLVTKALKFCNCLCSAVGSPPFLSPFYSPSHHLSPWARSGLAQTTDTRSLSFTVRLGKVANWQPGQKVTVQGRHFSPALASESAPKIYVSHTQKQSHEESLHVWNIKHTHHSPLFFHLLLR